MIIDIAAGIVLAMLFMAALPFILIGGVIGGLLLCIGLWIDTNQDAFLGLLIIAAAGVSIYLVGLGLYYLIPWLWNGAHGRGWTAKTREAREREAAIARLKARGFKFDD